MTSALAGLVASKPGVGVFNPACFIHVNFSRVFDYSLLDQVLDLRVGSSFGTRDGSSLFQRFPHIHDMDNLWHSPQQAIGLARTTCRRPGRHLEFTSSQLRVVLICDQSARRLQILRPLLAKHTEPILPPSAANFHLHAPQASPLISNLSFMEALGNWMHPSRKGPIRLQVGVAASPRAPAS